MIFHLLFRWRGPFARAVRPAVGAVLALAAMPAESAPRPPAEPLVTYADLVDLADRAPLVLRAQVRKVAMVEPERAPGLRAGWARLYVEARTEALLSGPPLTGAALRYLADVPLDGKGKVPKLAKRSVLLFARAVAGRPGELQLVAPDAQVLWGPLAEARLRGVLGELLAPGAPGRVNKVREAIHVPGNLAGEGETQLFLDTADGEPATITVVHKPGDPPRWSVSFSELADASGTPPERETLVWYRLACFLPAGLGEGAHVSATPEDTAQADADYAFVRDGLGACPRERR
jgi:hypothetical protein